MRQVSCGVELGLYSWQQYGNKRSDSQDHSDNESNVNNLSQTP